MGKNNANTWLTAVKKVFAKTPNDHEKRSSRRREENEQDQEHENKRGKRRWMFRKNSPLETTIQHNVARKIANSPAAPVGICTSRSAQKVVTKQPKLEDSTEERRAIAVAMATTAAAEAAVATAQAAVEIIRISTTRSSSLLKKRIKAAVVIQTIFRGYLARRALLALKGVVQLQALIRGHNVRRRANTTLQCIQSLVRVQTRVCDQRRRLSFEATSSRKSINSRNATSNTSNNSVDDHHPFPLEEIQSLIQKCSLKQGKTLAHALSHQMWRLDDDDQFSDNIDDHEQFEEEHRYRSVRKDRNLCNPTDPIKILEIDTSKPFNKKSRHQHSYSNSPKTPSSSNIRSIQAYSCSPRYQKPEMTPITPCSQRVSTGERYYSPVSRPSYMAATASAMARVRSNSTPRQRLLMSPSREKTDSVKKRLSFAAESDHESNADDKVNDQRMYKRIHDEQRSNVSSCCTY